MFTHYTRGSVSFYIYINDFILNDIIIVHAQVKFQSRSMKIQIIFLRIRNKQAFFSIQRAIFSRTIDKNLIELFNQIKNSFPENFSRFSGLTTIIVSYRIFIENEKCVV